MLVLSVAALAGLTALASSTFMWLRLIHRLRGPAAHRRLVRPVAASAAGVHVLVFLLVYRFADVIASRLLLAAWLGLLMVQTVLYGFIALIGVSDRHRAI